MTMQLPTDADAFARFLTEQIASTGTEKSVEELLRIWRHEQASALEDVRQGIQNMQSGHGVPFEEADQAIREEFGFSKKNA